MNKHQTSISLKLKKKLAMHLLEMRLDMKRIFGSGFFHFPSDISNQIHVTDKVKKIPGIHLQNACYQITCLILKHYK